MKNQRWRSLFFCTIAFFMAAGVPLFAETAVEANKTASNDSEILPAPGEARAVVQAASVSSESAVKVVPAAEAVVPAVKPEGKAALPASVVAAPVETKDLPVDQVFADSNPSGLVEVSGYKYPVYLFAPKDYKMDRTYAMVMLAPAESSKAEQQIEYLTGLAQRRSIFILSPYVLWPKEGDTPYTLDQWLLTVKKDVIERFPIDPKRVYLVGKGSGAHYAAYMAVKHPKEFAAVALLGEAWAGQFSQLVDPRTDAADQVPFYVALKAGGDAKARNQVWFDKLQQDGYPIHLVEYQTDDELGQLEFKKAAFEWMEATSQSWRATVAKGQEGWKGKFKKGVKDFFAV